MEDAQLRLETAYNSEGQSIVSKAQYLEWIESLRTFQEEFKTQASSAEKEFLGIGEKLQDFRSRAIGITDISSSVVNIVSSDDFLISINKLNDMQEHINGYLGHTKTELQTVGESLKDILKTHARVYIPVENFIKIVKRLRMLGIHIKILSAELAHESGDFKTLAADITSLASVIEKKTSYILNQTKASDLLVRETITKIADLMTALDNLTSLIIQGTKSTISSLSDRYNISSATAEHIALRSRQMSQGIGKVLELLQIHDIARQQTEAVKEELESLGSKLNNTPATDIEFIKDLSKSCASQSKQLSYVRDELSQAVKGIVENLRGISKGISLILEDTKNLAGTTNKNDRSFFFEMESGIKTILSSISETFFQCDKTRHELSKAVDTVVVTVGNISEFLKDIEQIGMEMELLSFNARIKAAHTGDLGAGLAVLAEAVQELSSDVSEKTIDLSNIFKDVTTASVGMNGAMNLKKDERDSQVDDITIEIEGLLENMRRNNSEILSSLTGIGKECVRLGCDIEEAVSGIKIDQIIHFIEKVISGLNDISRQTSVLFPSEIDIPFTPSLFEFRKSADVELF